MFKLNFKIAFRNLWKNKGYTLINIMGLAIGMTSCILIFIFIRYQLSFDEGYKNEHRIYRFVTTWNYTSFDDYSQGVPRPLPAAARNEFAGIEKVATISSSGGVIHVKDDQGKEKLKILASVFYAEPEFFEIFDLHLNTGSPQTALSAPNTVVLSENTAIKFFGSPEKALGKSIQYGTKTLLKVTGVFKDLPENSSFPLKIVISNTTDPGRNQNIWDSVSSQTECYVLLKEGVSITDMDQPLAAFNKKHYAHSNISGNQKNAFQGLRELHFNVDRYGIFGESSISRKELYGLAIIGLFLMVTACINFINLATAQAINRSKEVGVRKVMGSKRGQLILQFLTETFTITLLALLIAGVLTEIALPTLEHLFKAKMSLSLFQEPIIFLFLGGLVVLVSFLAGFYPALIMSGFSPALAIKNKVSINSGSLNLRKVLVVLQFSITIILIIATLMILRQMKYVTEKPLGFDKEAVTMVVVPTDSLSRLKQHNFKERVLQIPGVQMISFCQKAPLSGDMWTTNFSFNGAENKDFEIRLANTDPGYFELFKLALVAGKTYSKPDFATGYVVNETFLKKTNILNPEEALGKIIDQNGVKAPIIGVLKDYNDQSLKTSISPVAYFADPNAYYQAAIKIDPKQVVPAMEKINALWNETFPNHVFQSKFVDEDVNRYYESERITGILFRVFAGVIIFISFIGLFGLVSFVASQRTREVAIRKVLGASNYELIRMLNSSFLMMVFLANLIAWPLAYLFVSKWLSGFAYRTEISIWPFVLAMVVSMTLTFITVTIRSYKAAKANTIDALKYE